MTVLLVEDDETVRELLSRVLRADGYEVLAAASGEEVEPLIHANPQPLDLLVCDVCLPGESGPALADRLSRSYPDLRLLMMSGDPNMDEVAYDTALVADFLGKPFSNRQFIEHVRGLLQR